MKSEEQFLQETVGRENPFRVPEGYFETFPKRVMHEARQRKKRRTLWLWNAGVAASVAAVVCVWSFWPKPTPTRQDVTPTLAELTYSNEELEYALLTNSEIAYYLTDEDD